MARPERFELPTTWFVARYSIQLSYGRADFEGAHPITMDFPAANKDKPNPNNKLHLPYPAGPRPDPVTK